MKCLLICYTRTVFLRLASVAVLVVSLRQQITNCGSENTYVCKECEFYVSTDIWCVKTGFYIITDICCVKIGFKY